MAQDTGIDCVLSVGGTIAPAILDGCSPDFQRAMQPIIIANGGTPLIGYAPSTGAKSGFMTKFQLQYSNAATFLNACLSSTPMTVKMQFGASGGASVLTCLCDNLTVSGSEGGTIEGSASFQSIALPTVGATASAGSLGDVFKFSDVTSYTLVSTAVNTFCKSFSFAVSRNLISFHGNSPTGIAKLLKIGYTAATVNLTYVKTNDAEGTASIAACPVQSDAVILLTNACGMETLTLTASSAFYDGYPTTNGATLDFIYESVVAKAFLGGYTIA